MLDKFRRFGLTTRDNEGGVYWDRLVEFAVYEARTKPGDYYCHQCLEPTYYPKRKALWEAHAFEALLVWCNAHFSPDKVMVLWGSTDDAWGARLLTKAQVGSFGYAQTPQFPLLCVPAIAS